MPPKCKYKSAEIIDNSSDVARSDQEDASDTSSALTVIVDTRDSINQELDNFKPLALELNHKHGIGKDTSNDIEDPKPMTKKARKGAKKGSETNTVMVTSSSASDSAPGPDASINIQYNISIFPSSESWKEDVKKRKGFGASYKLKSDIPFGTWTAQLLVRISDKLNPTQIDFSDYDVSFAIPRIIPSPFIIKAEDDYNLLLEHAKKGKESSANIYVQEKVRVPSPKPQKRDKHNDNSNDETDPNDDRSSKKDKAKNRSQGKEKAKTKAKTRIQRDSDIEDEDRPINKNIQALRDHWTCNKKPRCSSEFCFVNPAANGEYLRLTFQHFNCWAAAMLKGPDTAMLDVPPNHDLFQDISEVFVKTLSTSTASLIATGMATNYPNFLPELLVQMIQASCTIPPAQSSNLEAPRPASPSATGSTTMATQRALFSPDQLKSLGERMAIEDFCDVYKLSKPLKDKLVEQGYNSTHALQYATIDDLIASSLYRGEIAQLHNGITLWLGK
ncbi:hypothetical protein EV363DRAFT_1461567 [Boletus edulis]|nr:hypothetical protein EV363DRAFT_1461567 [Boletus edulis]